MTREKRNARILEAIAERTARAMESKETARAFLIKEGIYDAEGRLRPEYGGRPRKAKPKA